MPYGYYPQRTRGGPGPTPVPGFPDPGGGGPSPVPPPWGEPTPIPDPRPHANLAINPTGFAGPNFGGGSVGTTGGVPPPGGYAINVDVGGGPWTPPLSLPGAVGGGGTGGPGGPGVIIGSGPAYSMGPTGDFHYYDAGNGVTYVYDSNWNYVGTTNNNTMAPPTGVQSGPPQLAGGAATPPNQSISTLDPNLGFYGQPVTGAGPFMGGNQNPNNPGYVSPGVGPQPATGQSGWDSPGVAPRVKYV